MSDYIQGWQELKGTDDSSVRILVTFKMQQFHCKKFPLSIFLQKYNKLRMQEALYINTTKLETSIFSNREKVTKIIFIHTMEHYAINTKNEEESMLIQEDLWV